MITKTPKLLSVACLLAFCGSVSAYTITGTVSDDQGKALRGVSVSLLKEGKNATTDRQGKFTIHEDEIITPPADSPGVAIHPAFRNSVGYISINNGILSYSQSSTSPVQVKIYNSLGNQVFKKLLQGSGTYDLSKGIEARGTYFAQVSVGNAKQNFKFTTDRGFSSSIGSRANGNALLKEAEKGEALRFVADGYDTLTVPLGTLDTTVDVKLTKIATEQTYAFGYPLKNDPTPSKGCGKDNTLKNYFKLAVSSTKSISISLKITTRTSLTVWCSACIAWAVPHRTSQRTNIITAIATRIKRIRFLWHRMVTRTRCHGAAETTRTTSFLMKSSLT